MAIISISLDLLASLPDLLATKNYVLYEYASKDGIILYGASQKDFAKITFDNVFIHIEIPGWDYPLDIFGIREDKEEGKADIGTKGK